MRGKPAKGLTQEWKPAFTVVALLIAVWSAVLVPVAPGITAAMGLLQTDMLYEHARSLITSPSNQPVRGVPVYLKIAPLSCIW
mgnify:CR=1 FL=1